MTVDVLSPISVLIRRWVVERGKQNRREGM